MQSIVFIFTFIACAFCLIQDILAKPNVVQIFPIFFFLLVIIDDHCQDNYFTRVSNIPILFFFTYQLECFYEKKFLLINYFITLSLILNMKMYSFSLFTGYQNDVLVPQHPQNKTNELNFLKFHYELTDLIIFMCLFHYSYYFFYY